MKRDKESLVLTIYLIVEALCKNLLEVPPQKQKLTDAEVITIAICFALFFTATMMRHFPGYMLLVIFLKY